MAQQRFRSGAALAAMLLLLSGTPGFAEPVFPAGGAIGLEAPGGFEQAPGYAGFRHPVLGISLVFAQFPAAAWPDMPDGMTPDALAAQGLERPTRRAFPVAGGAGLLVEGRQSGAEGGVSRWLLVFEGKGFTGFVNASVAGYPPPPEARAAVENALASIAVRAPDPSEQRAALPFTFEETEHLRFSQAIMGNTVLLAPPDTRPGGNSPSMIVALSPEAVASGDRAAQAAASVRSLAQFREVEVERTEAATLAGAEGVLVLAHGVGATDRSPRGIAYWVAFPAEGGLLRVLADAPAEHFDAAMPEFRRAVAGLSRR